MSGGDGYDDSDVPMPGPDDPPQAQDGGPSRGLRPLAPEGFNSPHVAGDLSRLFSQRSDGDLSVADRQWLSRNVAEALDRAWEAGYKHHRREVELVEQAMKDATPFPTQADAKAIPSPAPQAPPPEGIEDSDLDSTSVLGAMRGFLADHTRPNGSIAKDVSMHLRPSTVGCVLQIVALRTAERDAAIARAERAEKERDTWKRGIDILAEQHAVDCKGWVRQIDEAEAKTAACSAERDRMREKLERALRHLKRAEWRSEGHVCEVRRECKSVAQMIDDTLKAKPIPAPGGSSGEALGALAEYWRMPGVRATCMAHFSTLAEMIDKIVPPTPERRTAGEGT